MFYFRYGTGFGITGILFGKNSKMNASNGTLGAIFYVLQIVFGKKEQFLLLNSIFCFVFN